MSNENIPAKNLKFLMSFNKEKQTVLAKLLDISQSTISAYINGKMSIPTDIAAKIAYRYRISIDDFINKDLSFEYDKPELIDIKKAKKLSQQLIPIYTSALAKKDKNFTYAYEITKNAIHIDDVQTFDSKICLVEHAIELYCKAWEESKTYIALSNCISLILYTYAMYSQHNVEINQELKKENFDIIDLNQFLLRNPNKKNTINPYEGKRDRIFEKYYELVFENIKLLKENSKYSDLGDFYLILCAFFCFSDITCDFNACIQAAQIMLMQQFYLENKYAIEIVATFLNYQKSR